MRTTLKKVQKLVMNVYTSQKLVLQNMCLMLLHPPSICTLTISCCKNHNTFQDYNCSHTTKWFLGMPNSPRYHCQWPSNSKKNSNWFAQIIGPLIGKNNVWKHSGQKENINCQQCYGGGHKKWKQDVYNIDQ